MINSTKFIKETWQQHIGLDQCQPLDFIHRFANLHGKVKKWQREKIILNRILLKDIEKELKSLSIQFKNVSISSHIWKHIWDLGKKKKKTMVEEESTWRLKSRATWLQEGDKNTKFLHRYDNWRRQVNLVWEIKDEAGKSFFTQEDISNEAVKFF